MKNFFKYFDVNGWMIAISIVTASYVFNTGFFYTLLIFIIANIAFYKASVRFTALMSILVILFSFWVFKQNGTMMHRYLSTYEHGTSICYTTSKEIDSRCFKRGEDGVPMELGNFIKYEYIGKSFKTEK